MSRACSWRGSVAAARVTTDSAAAAVRYRTRAYRGRRRIGSDPRRGHASPPGAGPAHRPEPAEVRAHLAGLAMSARSWLPPPRACGCRARPHGPGRQEPRRAGVSRVAGLPHAAECNKAPFMYEMKGALFGYAAPARPVADRLVPVPPVSRLRRTSLAAFPAAPTRLGRIPGFPFPDRLVSQPHRFRIAWFPRLTVSGSLVPASPFPDRPVSRLAGPGRPVARPPRRHAPPAGAKHPRQIPVSRPFPRPGVAPGMVPVSCGESISTPLAARRARAGGNSFWVFFASTCCPQNSATYPHIAAVIHRLLHSSSTGYLM